MKNFYYIFITTIFMCVVGNAGVASLVEKPIIYLCKKAGISGSKKILSESAEASIKIACRETSEEALKFAAKYGDDAVKIFSRYGDDAVKITARYGDDAIKVFSKYGDDTIRIFNKYGDDGARVFIKHSNEVTPFIAKYGDDVIKPYIDHPGLGKQLIEVFGEDAARISGKIDDEAAILLIKRSGKYNKKSLIKKLLYTNGGKISKAKMSALIAGTTVVGYYGHKTYDKTKKFIKRPLNKKEFTGLFILIGMVIFYLVVKLYPRFSKQS